MNEKDKSTSVEEKNIDTASVDENFLLILNHLLSSEWRRFWRALAKETTVRKQFTIFRTTIFTCHLTLSIGKIFFKPEKRHVHYKWCHCFNLFHCQMSAALPDVMLIWLANFEVFWRRYNYWRKNKFNLTIPFYLPMAIAPLRTTLCTEKTLNSKFSLIFVKLVE